jgi:hypothetical protein
MKPSILRSLAAVAFCVCVGNAAAQPGGRLELQSNNPAPGGLSGSTAPERRVPRIDGQTRVFEPGTTPLFLSLAGNTATDLSGQPVGTIQYVVLGPGGTVDLAVTLINGRLIPVPWQLISAGANSGSTLTPGRVPLMINVDRQQLQQAPSIALNQLAQLAQDPTREQVFAFFGLQSSTAAAQGAAGVQTNVVTGASGPQNPSISPPAQSPPAISPPAQSPPGISPPPQGPPGISPPPQGPPGISPPAQPPPAQGPPAISRPPDIGPGSQPAPPR